MSKNVKKNTGDFRDSIATVDEQGGRIWIYPKRPVGKFYNLRTYTSWLLLIVLFGTPFIKVNGDPLFLFNVVERKFILFGVIFTMQDMHLLALAMISFMLFIVLFTVVFGRAFCGWVCPQTIFMEMVFRKIEYWIEGDANQQRRLNKAPWTTEKTLKKTLKHFLFFVLSVLIANTFLAYIIGVDQVQEIIQSPIALHMNGFIAMIVFSLIFYSVFAFFREQVCIAVCPYGRLQGVLLVKESIVVLYDWMRGEPRGKMKKQKKKDTFQALPVVQAEQPLGDCIDCTLCVQVCPTGIDIRNGTQLECVNCTACMDACDEVMIKINRPTGLIRYDSEANIEEGKQKIFTPRVWAYAAALSVLIIFQGFLFATRTNVEMILMRTPGMLYQELDDGYISNLYNYQIINKTTKTISNLELKCDQGRIKLIGTIPDAEKQGLSQGSFFIEIKEAELEDRKTVLSIDVYSDGKLLEEINTNFLGPVK